jgi:hypothetical protein
MEPVENVRGSDILGRAEEEGSEKDRQGREVDENLQGP